MNGTLQTTAIIRQRGQLTIPDKIRDLLVWLTPNAVVSVSVLNDGLFIKPHSRLETKKPDWKKIWEGIELARSFKGKRGNLSKFIAEDRYRH